MTNIAKGDTYLHPITVTATGIRLDGDATDADWHALLDQLGNFEQARQWIIGDAWNLCPWGSKAAEFERRGIKATTAKKYGQTAQRFPAGNRGGVPFGLAQVALTTSNPDATIADAIKRGLSTTALRKELKEADPDYEPPVTKRELEAQLGEVHAEAEKYYKEFEQLRDTETVVQERDAALAEAKALRAENARLKAEVRKLREALREPKDNAPPKPKRARRSIQLAGA